MDGIFFFVPLLVLLISVQGNVLERNKRQYGTEDYDPVTGAFLGECTFYGDYTTDCSGRLTCYPSDVVDRPTTSTLDQTCPQTLGVKSGRWARDQVVPSNMISRDAGSGRICKCQFYSRRQAGNFKCTSVQGDTWKGTYTGSLNTAFSLGLPLQSAFDTGNDRYSGLGRDTGRGITGDDETYRAPYTGSDRIYTDRNRDRDQDRYGTGTGRNDYGVGGGRFSTGITANDRDPSYTDNDATNTGTGGARDRYQPRYGGSGDTYDRDRTPSRAGGTSSEVVMCTYYSDGNATCRDCSERVDRKETTTSIRTTKHYSCTGAESKTTWTEDNGIMEAGTRPNPSGFSKKMVATCIFRPEEGKIFECHGGSTDGNCGTTNDGYGSSGSTSYSSPRYGTDTGSTTQCCLGGHKWTGRYSGRIY